MAVKKCIHCDKQVNAKRHIGIGSLILFFVRKKFYPVMYLISIATYIFTVGFVIDAFDFGRNGVLLTLAITSIIFIGIGAYMAKKFENLKDSFSKSISNKK